MDLSNLIPDICLLILTACVSTFIHYVYTWQHDMRSISRRLNNIENELQQHFASCSVNQQTKKSPALSSTVITNKKPTNIDLIRYHIQLYHPTLLEEISAHTLEKLTPTDELLCMMIKLEYSNKEVASILSITTSSVLTARYRLKKKLHLPHSMQLDSWITLAGNLPKANTLQKELATDGAIY